MSSDVRLCGECSRLFGEDVEQRKKRALSLEWYVIHVCSHCKSYIYVTHDGLVKTKEFKYVEALADKDMEKSLKV